MSIKDIKLKELTEREKRDLYKKSLLDGLCIQLCGSHINSISVLEYGDSYNAKKLGNKTYILDMNVTTDCNKNGHVQFEVIQGQIENID